MKKIFVCLLLLMLAVPACAEENIPLFKERGFKFKVQHPVLGYWRLLKKLHRVS